MPHAIHDIGVASQIGAYSDAVEARPNLRWLLTSGTPGLSTTGDLPKDILTGGWVRGSMISGASSRARAWCCRAGSGPITPSSLPYRRP